jgi:hypothetical protein
MLLPTEGPASPMWIFISHSTEKTDNTGRQRLLDVQSALTQAAAGPTGHDVLLDFQRLEQGFNWRTQLDEWMATCHAAVLMLTPHALDSWWVLKEATILAHRAARDPKFLLFPALLDGLTRQELTKDKRFSPVYLEAIQRIGGTQPADIAGAVLKQLDTLGSTPTTPFDRLVKTLSAHLNGADDEQLEEICASLTGQPIAFAASDKRHVRCAREVARAIVIGSRGKYATLRDLMAALMDARLGKEAALRILNLAAPLWVDSEAAAPLADVGARNLASATDPAQPATSWATAINGAYVPTFTAEMYLRRAYLPDTATLITLHGGESERRLDDLLFRLREEARAKNPRLQGVSNAKVDEFLRNVGSPYFVVLPPPFPDRAIMSELHDRYRKLTFIGHVEAEYLRPDLLDDRVVPLKPAVDLATEMAAFHEYSDAEDRITSA